MSRTTPKALLFIAIFLQSFRFTFAKIDTPVLNFLPGREEGIDIFVIDIINWMIGAASLVCVVMIIYSGYMYMTAGGDEQKVQTAQKTITGSLIGLAVSLLALVLVNFVLETFLNITI